MKVHMLKKRENTPEIKQIYTHILNTHIYKYIILIHNADIYDIHNTQR